MAQTVIAKDVILEDNVFLSIGVKTIYMDHKKNAANKYLMIKSGSFLGDNVVVMGGVTIAENCIIGACSFINKNTEPNGVYVGVPAIRVRDVMQEEFLV